MDELAFILKVFCFYIFFFLSTTLFAEVYTISYIGMDGCLFYVLALW